MAISVERNLNRSVVIGGGLIVFLVGGGILLSGSFSSFFSLSSALLVLGGTFGATLIHYSYPEIKAAMAAAIEVLFYEPAEPHKRIETLVLLSKEVQKEGPLVLESISSRVGDSFFKKALEVVADGQQPSTIKRILETEMKTSADSYKRSVSVIQTLGNYAPALGLIGTLVGLVTMMQSLNDPSTVGPAMAVALLTTLYGALLANLLFLPLAGKIQNCADDEAFVKRITLEGIISIRKGENPIVLEQRLESFL